MFPNLVSREFTNSRPKVDQTWVHILHYLHPTDQLNPHINKIAKKTHPKEISSGNVFAVYSKRFDQHPSQPSLPRLRGGNGDR